MSGSAGAGASSAGRVRWLARQPDPIVAAAVRSQRWRDLIQWKLGHAVEAIETFSETSTVSNRLIMRDGFNTLLMHPHEPWDLTKSLFVTSSYRELLLVQQSSRRCEKKAIASIAAIMRDLIVLVAVAGAGSHACAILFKEHVVYAFGGEVDNHLHAQLAHSYHQIMIHVPGAFDSVSKYDRLRRARVRRPADQSASEIEGDVGNDGTLEASRQRGSAVSVQHWAVAVESSQPMCVRTPEPEAPGLAELRKFMEADSIRLWQALQHEQVERGRLGDELGKMRDELELEQAEVARLTANLHPGARTLALFVDRSATLEELDGSPKGLGDPTLPSPPLPLLLFPPSSSSSSLPYLPSSFLSSFSIHRRLPLTPPPPPRIVYGPGATVQEGPDADAAAGSCRTRGGAVAGGPAADGQPRCGPTEMAGGLCDAEVVPISRVWQLEQELAEERRQRQLTVQKLAMALDQLAAALEAAAAPGSTAQGPCAEDEVLGLPMLRGAAPRSNAAVGSGAPAPASGGPRTLAPGCFLDAAPHVSRQAMQKQARASCATQHKP